MDVFEDTNNRIINMMDRKNDRIKQLEDAIRKHMEATGHKMCWENDRELWMALEGKKVWGECEHDAPPKDQFLRNCERYYEGLKQCKDGGHPTQFLIDLNEYEIANLKAALQACGSFGLPIDYACPLNVLHSGDWLGQIYQKLPEVKYKPNVTPEFYINNALARTTPRSVILRGMGHALTVGLVLGFSVRNMFDLAQSAGIVLVFMIVCIWISYWWKNQ